VNECDWFTIEQEAIAYINLILKGNWKWQKMIFIETGIADWITQNPKNVVGG
jgi:hypothetical protein